MKLVLSILISAVFFCSNIMASKETFITSEPVMKIRFNNPNVSYEHKLHHLIDKIFEIDSHAKFILVTLVPTKADAEDKQFAEKKSKEIANKLLEYGVDKNNIEYKSVSDKDVLNNEIHIFLSK